MAEGDGGGPSYSRVRVRGNLGPGIRTGSETDHDGRGEKVVGQRLALVKKVIESYKGCKVLLFFLGFPVPYGHVIESPVEKEDDPVV